MEIGLISDTHGYLDPRIGAVFADCDEIWHAGDFGIGIVELLAQIKPIRGVFGNIDDSTIRDSFPEDLRFEVEGIDVWITHIGGHPGHYEPRVRKELQRKAPDLLICGHSHILHVEKDPRFGGMQYLNPGAAGHQGSHFERTLLKFTIASGTVERIRLIELGPRGKRLNYPYDSPAPIQVRFDGK